MKNIIRVLTFTLALTALHLTGTAQAGGFFIQVLDTAGNVGNYASLAVIGGQPAVAYQDATNTQLNYIRCNDDPCATFSAPQVVDPTTGLFTSLADVGGLPTVSHYAPFAGDLVYSRCTDVGCTGANTVTVDAGVNIVGTDNSLAVINVGGLPAMSYYDQTTQDLKYARCDNLDCNTTININAPDTAGNVGRYSALVNLGGLPSISYYDQTTGNLKYARCTDANCTAANLRTLDAAGDVGLYTSIADVGGLPAMSYYDQTNGNLKYALCNNVDCGFANVAVVDAGGDVGQFTSLTTYNGLPVISYDDATNGNLKLAICNDTLCSTANLVTLDTAGDVGLFTSIEPIGTGVGIAYRDETNLDLKYAFVDLTPPTANPAIADNVTTPGGTTYTFTVQYNALYTPASLDVNDVTVTAPDGVTVLPITNAAVAGAGPTYVVTYTITPPGGAWDAADNGTYNIALNGGQVADQLGIVIPPNPTLTTFDVIIGTPDTTPPVAAAANAPDVTTAGGTLYQLQVRYTDDVALDPATIDTGDITITAPDGVTVLPITGAAAGAGTNDITATYSLTPPGGTWDATDNGTYTVAFNANQVADTTGNFAAANPALTAFVVNITDGGGDDGDNGDDDDDDNNAQPIQIAAVTAPTVTPPEALTQVVALPATGQTPWWRGWVLIGMGVGVVGVASVALRRVIVRR